MKQTVVACALALSCGATNVTAAEDAELAAIRKQIEQLKEQYEARIQALEKRLAAAERSTATAAREVPAPATAVQPSREAAFNPGISLILSGTYANLREDPESYRITHTPRGSGLGSSRQGCRS